MTVTPNMVAPVNIRVVAARANVSPATVSRVFGAGAPAYIRPETARRVRQAAAEIGYHPNAAARMLRRQRNQILGLLISDTADPNQSIDPVSALRIGAIESACAARGYGLQLMRSAGRDPARTASWIASRIMDGLIFTGDLNLDYLKICRQLNIFCLDMVGGFGSRPVFTIEADLVAARVAALRHAAEMGHRRIAVVCVDSDRQRRIFDAVARAAALDPVLSGCLIERIDLPFAFAIFDARPLIEAWRATDPARRPTAILAHENTLVAFLSEAAALGLQCPRDISLVGLSRTHLSDTTVPRLTGIDNRVVEAGRMAVNMMIDHLESGVALTPDDSPAPLVCNLVMRESCGAPPA